MTFSDEGLDVGLDEPVTQVAVVWAGVGLALSGYGLFDVATYSCGATATGGCGGPFGFVLVLWGLPILLLAVLFLLGRFARQRLQERSASGE